ncbi:MAG: tRNA (adenosine(37)-N6)-threonylcarbamoyltransferase complex ATPase subunit type 1 TsaE [Desulfovibrio sp.]|nr:tRNA (adenosine(37)-N6)-threonylcarbamoyltransferase complex ATPase subunit type 1 TsaE [Desulfovibrio sp.]
MILLETLHDTERLAGCLVRGIQEQKIRTIFLDGPLGSGKTTLVRALVSLLPGHEDAEVSSPSFSIVNIYPVTPSVQHIDLYRCHGEIDDEILDNLENPHMVTLIEWARFFPRQYWPDQILSLTFEREEERRICRIAWHGKTYTDLFSPLLNPLA